MIAIVDYGMGNLRSVQKAFEVSGASAQVTSDPAAIFGADKVVLPGVGAFEAAMKELRRRGLIAPLKESIRRGTPYLGLCLGLQLLFTESAESSSGRPVKGLGILPGRVVKFRGRLKVPHMGWNSVRVLRRDCPLLKGVKDGDHFYFVHSFYPAPAAASVRACLTEYGKPFCSAVWKDNVYAFQFHPEKSQTAGLRIIRNFAELAA